MDEKTVTTPAMTWKVKTRFDRNPRYWGRKILVSWTYRENGCNKYWKMKFRKVQELTDGQKKLYWKEPRSYFAYTKVDSYRIWISPMGSHSKLSSLWTNKMIGFTCQKGQLKICICDWAPELKPFQIEQFVNKQNHWVYLPKRSAENFHLLLGTRTQAPPMVMVWPAVTADGRSPYSSTVGSK